MNLANMFSSWFLVQVFMICFGCSGVIAGPCSIWSRTMYFDGYCFFVSSTTALGFNQSKVSCEKISDQFRLADPKTDLILGFLREMVTNLHLNATVATGVLLNVTLNRKTSLNLGATYVNNSEDCVQLLLNNLTLASVSCLQQNYYACQRYIGDPCESYLPGSEFYGGYCFKLNNEIQDWNYAQMVSSNLTRLDCKTQPFIVYVVYLPTSDASIPLRCAAFQATQSSVSSSQVVGSSLPSASSPRSNDSNEIMKENYYSLGATDEKVEGDFRWLTTEEPMTLCNWDAGQPNNNGDEDILVLSLPSLKINDLRRLKQTKSFCQMDIMIHTYLVVLPWKMVSKGELNLLITTIDNSTIYTVSQFMTNTSGCPALDQSITDVFSFLEPQKWISLDSRLELNSSGIFKEHVLIRSTQPITVVMITFDYTSYQVPATLILPTSLLTQNYFFLAPSHSSGQLSVTALHDDTNVTLKVPISFRQEVEITFDRLSIRFAGYITFTLSKYQTAVISATNFSTGLVYATRPVAVFSAIQKVVQQEVSFSNLLIDMVLPVEVMTSSYVTFPLRPATNSTNTYRLLATHRNASVKLTGSKFNTVIELQYGVPITLVLFDSSFYLLKSDAPFHVKFLYLNSTTGSCVAPLVPSLLWLSEYTFTTPASDLSSFYPTIFLLSEIPNFNLSTKLTGTCSRINGTSLTACIYQGRLINPGPISISNNGTRFAAHVSWFGPANTFVTCYPMGVGVAAAARDDNEIYDGPASINFNDASCQEKVYGNNATTGFPTSTVEQPTTYTTYISNYSTPSYIINPENVTSTENDTKIFTEVTSTSGRITTEMMITCENLLGKSTFGETATSDKPMTSSSSTSRSSEVIDSKDFVEQIKKTLEIDYTQVSAFKRGKISVPDSRVSATCLGMSGIFLLVGFLAIFLFTDILTVASFIVSLCLRKRSN